MPVILAIDAAWTATEPSGVAVVAGNSSGWQCEAVAPSYDRFFARAAGISSDWPPGGLPGSNPNVPRLMKAARQIAGRPIDLVVLDMPVATTTFSSRRVADDAISKEFGSRWCSAHTPNATRPGQLGARLSAALDLAEYPLATAVASAGSTPCLIEVYPHPALLSLLKRSRRVPYKVAKSRRYWPHLDVQERIEALLAEFRGIHSALAHFLGTLPLALPVPNEVQNLSQLKRYEDALDALVCAWVGIEYLNGRTLALGDNTAAIWCPRDVVINYRG